MTHDLNDSFQAEAEVIRWKMHFSSSPAKVYVALSTDEGRKRYWAESAIETEGKIHYVFLNDIENEGEVLEEIPGKKYMVTYFGWTTTFNLEPDGQGGTDMEMIAQGVADNEKAEVTAGWVSWLMAMKAAVDFGVDLRNHDKTRTWFDGYADN